MSAYGLPQHKNEQLQFLYIIMNDYPYYIYICIYIFLSHHEFILNFLYQHVKLQFLMVHSLYFERKLILITK